MKRANKLNDTPRIDTVQVRIALFLAERSFRELAAEWGCHYVTLWRAANNLNCKRGQAAEMRRRLAAFVEQVNHTHGKGKV
jgi:hypothetical protein